MILYTDGFAAHASHVFFSLFLFTALQASVSLYSSLSLPLVPVYLLLVPTSGATVSYRGWVCEEGGGDEEKKEQEEGRRTCKREKQKQKASWKITQATSFEVYCMYVTVQFTCTRKYTSKAEDNVYAMYILSLDYGHSTLQFTCTPSVRSLYVCTVGTLLRTLHTYLCLH